MWYLLKYLASASHKSYKNILVCYRMFLSKLKKRAYNFLLYNIILTFMFSIIYWILDKISASFYPGKSNGILYWLWFSLITQTTVGYMGPEEKTGKILSYHKTTTLFKCINFLQLFSVFGSTALVLNE